MNESTPKPDEFPPSNNTQNATIEAYLDELCAPLNDLPQSARDEIRQEIGAHLQSLLAMKREPERVLESALQQFGDPSEIGRLLALEWENREWDLSGLTVPQRIAKLRELLTERESIFKQSKGKNTVKKRNYWSTAAIVSVPLLQIAQQTELAKNWGLLRVLEFATFGACVFSSVFFIVLAIGAWRYERSVSKSAVSRFRTFVLHLSPAFAILMSSAPREASFFWTTQALFFGIVLLTIVLNWFEPSRKSKLVVGASMIWGGVMGISMVTLLCFFSMIGITSLFIQIPLIGGVIYSIRRLFLGGKPSKRQKAE